MDTDNYLVAVGASAGGLEALIDFVSNLQPHKNCCYVILQHLSPKSNSMLTEVLSRNTTLRVKTIEGELLPEADDIYVTPPNTDVIVKNGKNCFQSLSIGLAESPHFNTYKEPLRIWVPACACGQEAYTIAILLQELHREQKSEFDYRIFATDLDKDAIVKAREGFYNSDDVKNVPADLLERYFNTEGQSYRVINFIREKITFTKHSLINDPPFSRLDLISCRNLLIYFNIALQNQIYSLFHYALNENGLLLLGKSENITSSHLFSKYEGKKKLYLKNPQVNSHFNFSFRESPFAHHNLIKSRKKKRKSRISSMQLAAYELLATTHRQAVFIVGEEDNIVFMSPFAQKFAQIRSAIPSPNITEIIIEPLQAELKAKIFKFRRDKKDVLTAPHHFLIDDSNTLLNIAVHYNEFEAVQRLIASIMELDSELKVEQPSTKINQETLLTIKQLEQELSASQEEAQSANEELQSTNEELQTTNEELQSTNEELLTVNQEVLVKNLQLEKARVNLEDKIHELDLQKRAFDEHAIVVTTDTELKITYANNKVCQLCSAEAEQLHATRIDKVFFSAEDEEFSALKIGEILANNAIWRGVLSCKNSNNNVFSLDITAVPFAFKNESLFQYIFIGTDITARILAIEKAKVASNAKSNFLSSMSHEFRNPLNSILGFAQLLQKGQASLTAEKEELALKEISSNGAYLLELIDNVIDIAKIEKGVEQCETVDLDLCDMVKECVSLLNYRTIERDKH